MINFGPLRRLHRLHIQLALQAETSEDIVFPRLAKHQRKYVCKQFSLSEVSNDKILEVVQKAQDSAKLMVEELGMDVLFKKHSMWAPDVTVLGIDGGIHDSTFDSDDGEDSDIEDNDETDNPDSQDIGEEETCTDNAVEISNNLKTIFTHDLVDSDLEQRLQLRQKLLFERLPSSKIPMCQCVEAKNGKQTSSKKKSQNKFNPFVEVQASNNKTIFIRKTTALWLLQEGERISTDRLFQVRHKQPYSSTSLTINNKSNNIKPVMIAGNNVKDLSSSSLSDVIVIGDGDSKTEFSKPWLRIGTITLYDYDRQTILNGKWLWGTHLSAVQLLLKAQFPHLKGLEDTALVLRAGNTISPGSLQILHVNGNHWLTISTPDSNSSGYEVTVYDSLNFSLSKETKALLAKLLKTPKKRLMVRFGNTNKQAEFDECGLFAAAYCTTLAYSQNPSSYVYDQSALRKHLINCLEAQHIEPFPIIRERRIGIANLIQIDVFYYCRNTNEGTPMVCCDGCREWFHLSCINSKVEREKKWYCQNCNNKE